MQFAFLSDGAFSAFAAIVDISYVGARYRERNNDRVIILMALTDKSTLTTLICKPIENADIFS